MITINQLIRAEGRWPGGVDPDLPLSFNDMVKIFRHLGTGIGIEVTRVWAKNRMRKYIADARKNWPEKRMRTKRFLDGLEGWVNQFL